MSTPPQKTLAASAPPTAPYAHSTQHLPLSSVHNALALYTCLTTHATPPVPPPLTFSALTVNLVLNDVSHAPAPPTVSAVSSLTFSIL